MNKPISIVLLVLGILLLIWGANASDSFGSHVSRTVNGTPTDHTMWLLGGGAIALVLGLVGLFRGSRSV